MQAFLIFGISLLVIGGVMGGTVAHVLSLLFYGTDNKSVIMPRKVSAEKDEDPMILSTDQLMEMMSKENGN
jgi:hypothetical protein